jgi:hypothetical protein
VAEIDTERVLRAIRGFGVRVSSRRPGEGGVCGVKSKKENV